jgi:hypothetical protein
LIASPSRVPFFSTPSTTSPCAKAMSRYDLPSPSLASTCCCFLDCHPTLQC